MDPHEWSRPAWDAGLVKAPRTGALADRNVPGIAQRTFGATAEDWRISKSLAAKRRQGGLTEADAAVVGWNQLVSPDLQGRTSQFIFQVFE